MTQPIPAIVPVVPPTPAPVAPPTLPTEPARVTPEPADTTDWKAEARKWEDRAKLNKTAADTLAALEEANKTEAQKLTDRATAAELKATESELKATEAEARALRRDVALEHKLTKEDAALLDGMAGEDAMRALAARLAQQAAASATTVGAIVPGLGQTPETPSLDAQIAEAEAKGDTRAAILLKTRKLMQPN